MTDDNELTDEPQLVRSFISTGRTVSSAPAVDTSRDNDGMVRGYMMTGGRTTTDVELSFESMLSVRENAQIQSLTFERAAIVELCRASAQSVAELGAKLRVPIGVARILAGDLVSSKILEVHISNPNVNNDVALLKRLITGVRAL